MPTRDEPTEEFNLIPGESAETDKFLEIFGKAAAAATNVRASRLFQSRVSLLSLNYNTNNSGLCRVATIKQRWRREISAAPEPHSRVYISTFDGAESVSASESRAHFPQSRRKNVCRPARERIYYYNARRSRGGINR